MKFKLYTWDVIKKFKYPLLISAKIDGVQAVVKDGIVLSRKDKPLYNLPHLPDGIYEVFKDNWETSVSMVRKHKGDLISLNHIYKLCPAVAEDLVLARIETDVDVDTVIQQLYNEQVKIGREGLVIHDLGADIYYKVKPKATYDVIVLDVVMGKGKYSGQIGSLVTERGNVGSGLSDYERNCSFFEFIGETIEVECMSLTPNGKFRHPRFIRIRWDK